MKTIPKANQEYAALCAKTGLNQGQLADVLGVRRECISKRCNGKQVITKEALLAIKQVAAVPTKSQTQGYADLITEDEEDLLAGII